ncbi:energy-coupling factor transporter transmembrane component T [Lachnoclostridium sp. Marseille-P6806]|uniref:energy-coupling factor transporter transmembrane component T n=1 Tax=Lachnoclostridium sp. Marseille-P6806 TaxID=2364793 RepID=UPI0010311311|nr:energy-coupling factor transporter transmembrane component T [Lachnoclostridium sp. Marseille-P6806]
MRVNPLVVLLFNLLLPVAVMFPGNRFQHLFFLSFASFILLLLRRGRRLALFLCVYAVFLAASRVSLWHPGFAGGFFSVFFYISMQFIPCLMMASVLIGDYSPGELISALQPLHLPRSFVVSLVIVLRYIPTFRREFGYIRESMRLRGVPYSVRRPVQSFEFFLVPQLFRCALLADEITAAGLTKGITHPGRRSSYYDVRMQWSDYALCAALFLGTGVLILWR